MFRPLAFSPRTLSCSKCWDLQDSDQQPIRRHEGVNPDKKPGEQSCCKTLP